MERVTATITDCDKVLVSNVMAWVEVIPTGDGRLTWRGSFDLPEGTYIAPPGPFTFTTKDGRSGDILIARVTYGSHPGRIQFQGTGPFG